MHHFSKNAIAAAAVATCLVAAATVHQHALAQDAVMYEVKITNLTPGQQFTPVLAATHRSSASFFLPGTRASSELRTLAEGGDVAPLMALLNGRSSFMDVTASAGLTGPGATAMVTVMAAGSFDRVSLAAMLIPTNDTFVGLNTALPEAGELKVAYAYAYDAGTERNDEECASIPGPNFPECAGPGGGATVGNGEGHVVISSGISGLRDFGPDRDWRNPVARVTIRRVS